MIRKYIIIYFLLINFNSVFAQDIILKGNVVDSKNNLSLSGVTIKVGTKGTITDKNGDFILKTQLNTLIENGINFSFIGYLTAKLIYQPNHFYKVKLTENILNLKEVVVGGGDDIMKRAIKNIPINYSDKPIIIKGILRIQTSRNKSEYFKSDALIKAYIPSYSGNQKTTVSVLQNRIDTLYDKSLKYLKRLSYYNVVDFQDIVHDKYYLNKISKKKKFDYWLAGKQFYNNHNVYVINTSFKDTSTKNDKIDATFYIDTASYAIVAANIFRYNIKWAGVLPIDILNYQVTYDKIGTRWYLSEIHNTFNFVLKNQSPRSNVDFIRTEIDTINVDRIRYKDFVQNSDNILKIDKYKEDFEWIGANNLIQKAENEGKMGIISDKLLDTIKSNNLLKNPPNQLFNRQFGRKVFDYLTNNNLRSSYGLIKSPFVITSESFNVAELINYAIGFNLDARVYKNLFLGFQRYRNLNNKKQIDLANIVLNLSNEIILNKVSRSFILKPNIGFECINASYQNAVVRFNSINCGLRISYELTHKKAMFLSSSYNTSLKTARINEIKLTPSNYTIGFGIVFK